MSASTFVKISEFLLAIALTIVISPFRSGREQVRDYLPIDIVEICVCLST